MVVIVKCGVLFELRTEFLNIMKRSIGFKGLIVRSLLLELLLMFAAAVMVVFS
jgi:hypothetical protein